jgi:hypothetical protein
MSSPREISIVPTVSACWPREPAPALAIRSTHVQHVLERAGKAVELPNDDYIILRELIEKPMQLRPIPPAARSDFLEYAIAAGSP